MVISDLSRRRCQPLPTGAAALSREQAQALLAHTPGWSLDADARSLERLYQFQNYYETMAFVNALAWVAHREDHHPDIEVGYNRCRVRYNTHTVKGLSENDFICAAKLNLLQEA